MSDTPATPRQSRESTRRAWAERLRRFEESGLSVVEFCRSEAIASQSFYYWRSKLLRGDAPRPDAEAVLLPVRVLAAAPVELLLPGGPTLRLSPGCDLAFVRSLVQALAGGGPC